MNGEPVPVRIEGRVELSDGSITRFSIEPDLGWNQWGNSRENLGVTVELMDELAAAASEHIRDPEEE